LVSRVAGEAPTGKVSRIRSRRLLQADIKDAILADYILSGRVPSGSKLPSETELATLFSASRVTVRTALQSLKDQGYINIVRGSGSHVLPRPESIHSGLDRLCSFDAFAVQSGRQIATEDLIITRAPSDDIATSCFVTREPITKVSRVKVIGGTKVALIVDYVPETALPFDVISREFDGSVLDLLLKHGDLAEYADCTITPVVAAEDIKCALNIPTGNPLLHLSELTRNSKGQVTNRSEAWLSPDTFKFQLRRRRED
jgi:GntR family transcriptional regulator